MLIKFDFILMSATDTSTTLFEMSMHLSE